MYPRTNEYAHSVTSHHAIKCRLDSNIRWIQENTICPMYPAGFRLGILCLLNFYLSRALSLSLAVVPAALGQLRTTRITRGKTPRSLQLLMWSPSSTDRCLGEPHVENVLFVECGKKVVLGGCFCRNELSHQLLLACSSYYSCCLSHLHRHIDFVMDRLWQRFTRPKCHQGSRYALFGIGRQIDIVL